VAILKKIILLLLYLFSADLYAQNQIVNHAETLDTLQITSYNYRANPKNLPKHIHIIKITPGTLPAVQNIDELLAYIAAVDVRTRGSKGVQADLSIRGGNFDQVLVLLNGIPINNPQTGHHHLDVPVDLSMLDHIEILEGASGLSFGVNAYSGAINLVTKDPEKTQAQSSIKAGQYGYLKANMDLAHQYKKIAVYNGFTYQRSSGYLTQDSINNTDFYSIKDFIHIRYNSRKLPIDFQAAYHQKAFGANSFYTSKYPWQYEKTHGYYAALSTHSGKKIKWQANLFYKLHFDEFQLFRESVYQYENGYFIHQNDTAQYAPHIYYPGHNYHKTQVTGGAFHTNFTTRYGKTFVNFSIKNEKIWSNKLGKTLTAPIQVSDRIIYTKSDERTYVETGLNHQYDYRKITLGGGLNLLFEKKYGYQLTGGMFVNFHLKHFAPYVSLNSASRLPTFTDLYYAGPANIGNPDLEPETAVTFEAGTKYFNKQNTASLSIFKRSSVNTIDWIKYHPADKWQPQNLTNIQTYGVSFDFTRRFTKGFFKKVHFSYAYLDMQKDAQTTFISKYVLDYLKHKAVAELSHRFWFHSSLQWSWIYKNRTGQYLDYRAGQYQLFDYKPYHLVHLKWYKSFKKTSIGMSIENLFDITYNDLSYVKMPGRWIIFELNYKIN